MAVPIVPIIKKVATKIGSAVASNKKGRKTILTIIGIILVILLMPIIALMGIFNDATSLSFDKVNQIINEKQAVIERTAKDIEELMYEEGYTPLRIEEAQALYSFVLVEHSEEDGFVKRYVACFEINQTDAELIDKVNEEFDKTISVQEYQDTIQEIRDRYAEAEENVGGD